MSSLSGRKRRPARGCSYDQVVASSHCEASSRNSHGVADSTTWPPSTPAGIQFITSFSLKMIKSMCDKDALHPSNRDFLLSTCFAPLMSVPVIPKINRQFIVWLYSNIDTASSSLVFSDNIRVKVTNAHIHSLTGLPMTGKPIILEDIATQTRAESKIVHSVLGNQPTDQLKTSVVAREYKELCKKPLSTEMQPKLAHCFGLLYVGHFIAPSNRNDPITPATYTALADVERWGEYNWCEFIRQGILRGGSQINEVIRLRHSRVILTGSDASYWPRFLLILILDHPCIFYSFQVQNIF